MRWIDLGLTKYWQTQAVYHALAKNFQDDSEDTILVCRPASPYLCAGFHQDAGDVLDLNACQARNLPVLQRWVGGGTTYLDADQLFYQCIFHPQHLPASVDRQFQALLAAPVRVLNRLGIPASLSERNEISAEGKRLAGTGGGRIEQAVVVVGNLLLDFDYETMLAVWKVPSPGFRELASLALRNHVGTIRAWGVTMPVEQVLPLCREEFERTISRPLYDKGLTEAEEAQACQIWGELRVAGCGGRTSPQKLPKPLKIAAGVFIHYEQAIVGPGCLAASLYVQNQVILAARIETALPGDWQALEQRLQGAPLHSWKSFINR